MPAKFLDGMPLGGEDQVIISETSPDEVVVSGISGRLPESDNIAEFREHLMKGEDMVTEDERRWTPGSLSFNLLLLLSFYCLFYI